jgi:tetratricopeptide (TPR) repeat protein
LRPEGEARPELVAALESYLRVEQEPEARKARRSLPAPLDDQEAVAAARAAFQRIAEDYHATSQTRAPLNLGIYLAGYSPTEASVVLQEAAREGPNELVGETYAWLGVVLGNVGDAEGAVGAYVAAIDSGQSDQALRSMVNLGELYLELGQPAAAREWFEEAMASGEPIYAARAQVDLAQVLVMEGDLDAAQAIYEQAFSSEDARVSEVAAAGLRSLDIDGDMDVRERAGIVLQRLVTVPDWYQTRQILLRFAALLPDVEALFREAERAVSAEEPGEFNFAEHGEPFLTLISRAREIGIEAALAEKSGLGEDVPVDVRLLFLQAEEASDRFGRDGGRSSLADASSACAHLLQHPVWAELPPALRLDCVGRLTDALSQLYVGTGDVDFLDQMLRSTAWARNWAREAGLDTTAYADEYDRLLNVREDARPLRTLIDFVDAIASGDASECIGEHPELLDEVVLDRLSSRLQGVAAEHRDDEDIGRMQFGVDILRLSNRVGIETALQTVGSAGAQLLTAIEGMSTDVDGLRRHIRSHPELLSESADLLLERFIQASSHAVAGGQITGEGADQLQDVRELLRRCREIGIDAAIDEKLLHQPAARPSATPYDAGQAMAELLDAAGPQGSGNVAEVLERHRDVLLTDKTDAVLSAMVKGSEDSHDDVMASAASAIRHQLRRARIFGMNDSDALSEFIALPGSPEATFRRLLQEHPTLLEPVTDEFLADVIGGVDDGDGGANDETASRVIAELEARRRLLRDCRQLGVEAAIAFAWSEGEFLPDDLRIKLTQAFELGLQIMNGELKQPDAAEELWRGVLEHPALAGRPHPLHVTEQYAVFNLLCHRRFDVAGAIDAAVSGFEEAVGQTDPDDPWLSARLQFLADALTDRYEVRGQPDDLRRAVSILDRAAELPTSSEDDAPIDHNILAKALFRWHDRFGTQAELDRAILALETAAEAAGTADNRTTTLTNLSLMLGRRYLRDGRLDDLNRAIAIDAGLAEQPVSDQDGRAALLGNQGIHLLARYDIASQPADLSAAIQALEQAVRAARPGSRGRPRYLTTLGTALIRQARNTERRSDAKKAIAVLVEAVEATGPGSFERANRLNNLGAGYLRRYQITGRLRHLDEAIQTFQQGLGATAADAPGYAWRAANLASALSNRYRRSRDPADLERATALFRDSVGRNLTVNLEVALRVARAWGGWAVERLSWAEAAHAYTSAMEASERLFKVQLVRGHKRAWLREAGQLFDNTAQVLLRAGDPAGAVRALELGRARLMSEAIEIDRAELYQLSETGHGSLRDRYLAAARRLRELQTTNHDDASFAGGST